MKSQKHPSPCSVSAVKRQVIENKLLAALDDRGKVAILATEEDLEIIITALLLAESNRVVISSKYKEMRADLEQLRSAAFPPNN